MLRHALVVACIESLLQVSHIFTMQGIRRLVIQCPVPTTTACRSAQSRAATTRKPQFDTRHHSGDGFVTPESPGP